MKINRTAKSQQKQNRNYWKDRIVTAQDNLFDKTQAEISARVGEHYQKALATIRADMTDILMKVASGDYNMNELYKFDRYAKLQAKMNEALKSLGQSEIEIMDKLFKDFYKNADSLTCEALKGDDGVGASFSVMNSKAVENAVGQIWCADGQKWSSRIWKNKALLQSKLERGLVDCIARGGKADDLKRNLMDTFNSSFSEADRIVRTELAQLQNSAAVERYKEAGVKEVKTIACKDSRTCKICQKKDGKKHPIDKALPGIAYLFHPNCRCQVVPAMDISNWTAEDMERIAQAEVDRLEKFNRAKAVDVFDYDKNEVYGKITPESIMEELQSSAVGREAVEYFEQKGIKPKLIYDSVATSDRGSQQGDLIKINIINLPNSRVAAQTIIHEMTHHKYDIGGCQWAEAVCMAKEKMHIVNRTTLTMTELRYIVKLAKDNYQEYNWRKGGYRNGKRL